jgi:acyl dehydratase
MNTRVHAGDAAPRLEVGPLKRTDFVRYAGASNDFNPIHHDDEFARAAGQESVFGHGMLSAGLLGSTLTRWFGPRSVARIRVRFVERVWPGDVLHAEGTVSTVDGAAGTAEVELSLHREDGTVVVRSDATVWIDGEEVT